MKLFDQGSRAQDRNGTTSVFVLIVGRISDGSNGIPVHRQRPFIARRKRT